MTQVSAGGYFALARRAGSVWAWGINDSGQLGNGSTVADSATPVIVGLGREHNGELGLGTTGPAVRTPQKVPGLSGVTQLSAAYEISMALRSDGTLLVWGYEGFGLRGDGVARTTPLPVPPR
jgi:alpha-tubulin suppressor-like RCC1 family protein